MTNSIILQLKIEKQKNINEKKETELKIKRCFCELSNYLIPYFKTSKDIKASEIEQIGDELLTLKNKLAEIEEKIYEIQEQLGENG